jgi:hypothetical protein
MGPMRRFIELTRVSGDGTGPIEASRLRRAIDPSGCSVTLDIIPGAETPRRSWRGPTGESARRQGKDGGNALDRSSRSMELTFARVALGSAGPAVGTGSYASVGHRQRHSTSLPRRRADRVMGLLSWPIGLLVVLAIQALGLWYLRGTGRTGGPALSPSAPGENRTEWGSVPSGGAWPVHPGERSKTAAPNRGKGWSNGRHNGRCCPELRPWAEPWSPAPIGLVGRSVRGRCSVGTPVRVRLAHL